MFIKYLIVYMYTSKGQGPGAPRVIKKNKILKMKEARPAAPTVHPKPF